MNKITAVVVTHNEEENIGDCLKCLDFVQEILVIDTESSDKTVEIASLMGAKVIKTEIIYPEEKKNSGIKSAAFPWILVVDADERVTPELKSEIERVLGNPEFNGYWIYRKNFFLGKEIKYCGWRGDKVIRLFKKNAGEYPEKRVHGKLRLNGRTGVLKSKLLHHSYRNVSDYFKKIDIYTKWNARDLKGKKVCGCKLFLNPASRFINMYFSRLGFLDGISGFILCVMASFSVFIKYLRIYLDED